MGIAPFHAEVIIREHKFRPLPKTVHLLGRQTVQLDYAQALRLLEKNGIEPVETQIEFDHSTHLATASGNEYISDRMFFGLLGVESVRAIDHSDYEGADIILDLNQPIPESLEGSADFLYGGSVLDNIFDPASYLKNMARILRPGGRLIDQNLASFNLHPYVVVSPAWLYDYFVINNFADCKIYFLQSGVLNHVYGMEVQVDQEFICDMGNAPISSPFATIVVAEKSGASTWNRIPSQDQYRARDEWDAYRSNMRAMQASSRRYALFSAPSVEELSKVSLRRTKSFAYLGLFSAFDEREPLRDPSAAFRELPNRGLRILEATYGLNVLAEAMPRPGILPLCRGNVTETIAGIFNGRPRGEFVVDFRYFGDPAPEKGKDLTVLYYHLDDPEQRVRTVYLPAEAHGKTLSIPPL